MILKLILISVLLCAAFAAFLCIGNSGGDAQLEGLGWVALVVICVCIGLTTSL